jgi:hypothetical protein
MRAGLTRATGGTVESLNFARGVWAWCAFIMMLLWERERRARACQEGWVGGWGRQLEPQGPCNCTPLRLELGSSKPE